MLFATCRLFSANDHNRTFEHWTGWQFDVRVRYDLCVEQGASRKAPRSKKTPQLGSSRSALVVMMVKDVKHVGVVKVFF